MVTFHAFLGCSLDGFIAGPHDELDWLTSLDDGIGETGYDAFFDSIGAMAMGRGTYDVMRDADPSFYRGRPIHVVSTTLPAGPQAPMGDSAVTVHPDLDTLAATLDADGVERAYLDGGRTVQHAIVRGLLTDLVVTRVPVLLGEGIPLFGPVPSAVRVELANSRVLGGGAVQSTYRFPVAPR